MIARLARYGHQPLPVILGLSIRNLRHFDAAVCRLIERENGPSSAEG